MGEERVSAPHPYIRIFSMEHTKEFFKEGGIIEISELKHVSRFFLWMGDKSPLKNVSTLSK